MGAGASSAIRRLDSGKYRDLDIHEGQYCDKLTGYVLMQYDLYALAEEHDLKLIVGNEIAQ